MKMVVPAGCWGDYLRLLGAPRPLYAELRADVFLPMKNLGGDHDNLADLS
jgi:hypothetical protein